MFSILKPNATTVYGILDATLDSPLSYDQVGATLMVSSVKDLQRDPSLSGYGFDEFIEHLGKGFVILFS
jgi:hypothetical protein